MSNPILPLLEWPPGIQQASVPANDNALRNEALSMPALGVANDESAPDDGDIWIVGDTPAGAFASFDEHDIALYRDGWHAWAPIEGVRLVVADVRKLFDGAEWIDDPSVTGGSGSVDSVNGQTGAVVLEADDIDYDNLASGLTATDVQAAIDEVVADMASLTGTVVDVTTPSNASGTVTLDFAGKSKYIGAITLAANVTTLAFSNLPGAGKYAEYELHIAQDGTGSRTFAIPASHKALGGSDTAIASAASAVTVLTGSTVDNGTTWRYAMQESA